MVDIFTAIKAHDPLSITLALTELTDLNVTDISDYTPLMCAVEHSNVLAVELLLEKGADVHGDGYTSPYLTPLHLAVETANLAVIEMLLGAGADPNEENLMCTSPVHVAGQDRKPDVLHLLEKYGGNMSVIKEPQWSAYIREQYRHYVGLP